MELLNEEEFKEYIRVKYKLLFKSGSSGRSEIAGHCDYCKRDVFLKVHTKWHSGNLYRNELPSFVTFLIQCPSCQRKSFIQTLLLDADIEQVTGNQQLYEYYRIYNIPTSEHRYEIKDIPSEHLSLKKTIAEAVFCLDNSQYVAAAIMFRRGLQIMTKDVLGALGKDLYKQLEWLKSNPNKLGVNLTNLFHENSELIRKIGNQGAHPDDDITLHEFTEEDANGLHDLFIAIIHEVFVLPAKMKALQEELKQRRRIK